MKELNKNPQALDIDIIHQEAAGILPEETEQAIMAEADQLAQEAGITLKNPLEEAPADAAVDNKVLLQAFEWYLPDDGQHWNRLKDMAPQLLELGIGGVWLPPCSKATGTNDVGYGIYDLWDLGEFDQKGAVRTKYGTREELQAAIGALQEQGLQVYADVVLNHKAGADENELFQAVKIDPDDRNRQLSEPYDIRGWTRFTYPGRAGKYSDFVWNFSHFTAVDYDDLHQEGGIFRILGENKGFSPGVDQEKGNFDYLMFADVDYRNKDVIAETIRWGEWFVETLGLDGMRLDALKHINSQFMAAFLRAMRLKTGKPLYFMGEYWRREGLELVSYLDETDAQMALFDVALHFHFQQASLSGRDYDLRTIFDGTLIKSNPLNAVTFVDNHDSQQGQALQSWVDGFFKELAYALILLRKDGYPCLFWGDYYGISGGPNPQPGWGEYLEPLLRARKEAAYGEQVDYFDHGNCIGWVRLGDDTHPGSGLAVVMSNSEDGNKHMSLGALNAGTTWQDITGRITDPVTLDETGCATFYCKGQSVSVYKRV